MKRVFNCSLSNRVSVVSLLKNNLCHLKCVKGINAELGSAVLAIQFYSISLSRVMRLILQNIGPGSIDDMPNLQNKHNYNSLKVYVLSIK